jgi:hypothetical protein
MAAVDHPRQAGAIEITPAMIEAGVRALEDSGALENGEFVMSRSACESLAALIFKAMAAAAG